MKAEFITAFEDYCGSHAADCRSRKGELLADSRADEASFEQIKGNIYELFGTVLSAAVKNCGTDADVSSFFQAKAEQITAAWRESQSAANAHGDSTKAHIEVLKLETAEEIRSVFEKLWREYND